MDPIALYLTSYCRIALPCIDLHTFLSCMCVSSYRVDTDTEQFEHEYEYHPQEDPACTTTADLTGEPSPFTYFTVLVLLLYCYPYVAILFDSRVLLDLLPI
jgi:hypothetical protein